MDFKTSFVSFCVSSSFVSLFVIVQSADPDPVQDFCVSLPPPSQNEFLNGLLCKNPMDVVPGDFSSQLLRNPGSTSNSAGTNVTLAFATNFGGLNTQGLSYARIDFAERGLVPPHNHPRASEVTFLVYGKLVVGFVDTSNNLHSQTLYPGDLFIFPRALVHFLLNVGNGSALSLSALNSQNPGATLLPNALFDAKPPIPPVVLEKAFLLSVEELDRIRAALGG